MRKNCLLLAVVVVLVFSGFNSVQAMGDMGKKIYETRVDVNFEFKLIDMRAKTAGMNMANTHHLMVYLKDSAGKPITDVKIKYKIIAPNDETQTAKPMAMNDGFGADVNLAQKGKYEIICQAGLGKNKLTVRFYHTIK